jgi:hypothetical protein
MLPSSLGHHSAEAGANNSGSDCRIATGADRVERRDKAPPDRRLHLGIRTVGLADVSETRQERGLRLVTFSRRCSSSLAEQAGRNRLAPPSPSCSRKSPDGRLPLTPFVDPARRCRAKSAL